MARVAPFIAVSLLLSCGPCRLIWAADGGESVMGGRVTMEEQGLPGVTVTATGPVTAQAVTSLAGTYRFAGLPAGEYTVTLTQDGLQGTPARHLVVFPDAARTNLDFEATPSLSLLPMVRLTPSSALVRPGDTFVLRLSLTPGSQEPVGDLYLFLVPPGTTLHSQEPWQANLQVPAVTDVPVFSHTIVETDPPGIYTWLAFFTRPGTQDILGPVVSASVTVHP